MTPHIARGQAEPIRKSAASSRYHRPPALAYSAIPCYTYRRLICLPTLREEWKDHVPVRKHGNSDHEHLDWHRNVSGHQLDDPHRSERGTALRPGPDRLDSRASHKHGGDSVCDPL